MPNVNILMACEVTVDTFLSCNFYVSKFTGTHSNGSGTFATPVNLVFPEREYQYSTIWRCSLAETGVPKVRCAPSMAKFQPCRSVCIYVLG